jgi:tRNA U34 2-thiouridine synthase MnmA/TrmU
MNRTIILYYKKTLFVTPGQFAVLYQNNICLGGGIISKVNIKTI